jgi:hypothetical protein
MLATGLVIIAAIDPPGPPSNKRGVGSMRLGSEEEERDGRRRPTLANAAAEGQEKAVPPVRLGVLQAKASGRAAAMVGRVARAGFSKGGLRKAVRTAAVIRGLIVDPLTAQLPAPGIAAAPGHPSTGIEAPQTAVPPHRVGVAAELVEPPAELVEVAAEPIEAEDDAGENRTAPLGEITDNETALPAPSEA